MNYPHLDTLIKAYLNQDYEYWGSTLEEVIDAFKRDSAAFANAELRAEIKRYVAEHPDDLDAAFTAAYGFDFDPALWDTTTLGFFQLLDARLAAP